MSAAAACGLTGLHAANLNTTEREGLLCLSGVDAAMVDRVLDSRCCDSSDLIRRDSIDAQGALREAAAALLRMGPYRRQ